MEKEYVSPELEIIVFGTADIMETSNPRSIPEDDQLPYGG